MGFCISKEAEVGLNNCSIPELNDLFELVTVRKNGNELIPKTYNFHYNKYVNWWKYCVKSGNREYIPRLTTYSTSSVLANEQNVYTKEISMVGDNSINLSSSTSFAIDKAGEYSYRFVKICEIVPFLYELGWVSLTDGDFHI